MTVKSLHSRSTDAKNAWAPRFLASLSAKCPHTKAVHTETTESMQCFPRFHKAPAISQDKVLPVFLTLDLHTPPPAALEEVPLVLQPHFSISDEGQKNKPFLSGLLTAKGKVLCQAPVPWTLRSALDFHSLLSEGAQGVS